MVFHIRLALPDTFLRQLDKVLSVLFQEVAILPRPVQCAIKALCFNMRKKLEAGNQCRASDALTECSTADGY